VASDGNSVTRYSLTEDSEFATILTDTDANIVRHVPAGPYQGTVVCGTDSGSVEFLGTQLKLESINNSIYDLSFSSDGRYLAVGGDQGSVLYQLREGISLFSQEFARAQYAEVQVLDREAVELVSFGYNTRVLLTSGSNSQFWALPYVSASSLPTIELSQFFDFFLNVEVELNP